MDKKIVRITPSLELYEWKLWELVGRVGAVIAKGEGNSDGYWVQLANPYLGEEEWFVPISAMEVVCEYE